MGVAVEVEETQSSFKQNTENKSLHLQVILELFCALSANVTAIHMCTLG